MVGHSSVPRLSWRHLVKVARTSGPLALVALGLLAGTACAPAAAPAQPTAAPPAAKITAPTAAPAAPAAAQSTPAQAAPAAANANWQAEWDRTVEAAKKEGTLVISSSPGDAYRLPIMEFEKAYPGIKLEYNGATSPNFWPRFLQERAAGQNLWDLRVGGPDPQVFRARDEGYLAPVRPLLLLPEVADEKNWMGGLNQVFSDKEKQYVFTFFGSESITQFVNRDFVSEAELPSARELVQGGRFKGKIALGDPRGGPGLGQLTNLIVAYGDDYVRSLLADQDAVSTTDLRQLAEWTVRGRYPIAIGLPKYQLETFVAEGLGSNVKPLGGPVGLTNAAGGIQYFTNAPHPNAAKVFINWLLTKDVQTNLAKATLFNSYRVDAAPGDPNATLNTAKLSEYVEYQSEKYQPYRDRAEKIANEVLK